MYSNISLFWCGQSTTLCSFLHFSIRYITTNTTILPLSYLCCFTIFHAAYILPYFSLLTTWCNYYNIFICLFHDWRLSFSSFFIFSIALTPSWKQNGCYWKCSMHFTVEMQMMAIYQTKTETFSSPVAFINCNSVILMVLL